MATIKSGVGLQLGLVNCTVNVKTAILTSKEVALSNICTGPSATHPPSGVKQKLECPECGNNDRSSFLKGHNTGTSKAPSWAVVDPDAVKQSDASDQQKMVMALSVVNAQAWSDHVLPSGTVYHLEPAKGQEAHYALLMHAVTSRQDAAFTTVWAARTLPALYRIEAWNGALLARQYAWPEYVEQSPAVSTSVDPAMAQLLDQLVDGLLENYDPNSFVDTKAKKVAELVAAAGNGIAAPKPTEAPKPTDLMAVLQAAITASKEAA